MQDQATLDKRREALCVALESGQYQQGQRCLCFDNCYCCLGVACMVAKDLGALVDIRPTDVGDQRFSFNGYTAVMPYAVQEFFGFKTQSAEYVANNLVQLNDSEHKTFAEIAAVIRSKPKGLFQDAIDS